MEQVRQAFALQVTPGVTPAQIKETNVWLEKFQNTQEAWQVADQLLAEGTAESNAAAAARPEHIFAAQTMRVKIQYDWAELPQAQHAALRTSLMQHVLRFGQGPNAVLRQLCLAVGVLALHMEDWHATIVTDLIQSLTQPPETAASKLPCLLELLLVLPEEAENYKVNVVPRRRDNFRSMLSAHSSQVLMLLHQVCTQFQSQANTPSGEVVLNGMMKCVSSWMHYVAPENREFQDALASLPLIPFGFSALAHKPLFDAASDLVVETVHFAADSEARDEMVPKVLPSVLSLVPLYDAAVAAEDEESAKSYCRIFAEAGEQFLNVSRRHRRRGRRRRHRCRRRRRVALNARMPMCSCAHPLPSPPVLPRPHATIRCCSRTRRSGRCPPRKPSCGVRGIPSPKWPRSPSTFGTCSRSRWRAAAAC